MNFKDKELIRAFYFGVMESLKDEDFEIPEKPIDDSSFQKGYNCGIMDLLKNYFVNFKKYFPANEVSIIEELIEECESIQCNSCNSVNN